MSEANRSDVEECDCGHRKRDVGGSKYFHMAQSCVGGTSSAPNVFHQNTFSI